MSRSGNAPPPAERPVCWVLTDGKAGNVNPALGLAERAGLAITEISVALARPWVWLPPGFWPPGVLGVDRASAARLTPPWPDVTLSCGRRAIGPALEIKRRSGGRTKTVHIQHPRMTIDRFDLLIVPEHDQLSGPNVEVTCGSVHRVTREKLDAAAREWAGRLAHLPAPRIAVCIGGKNAAYRFDAAVGQAIGADLATLARDTGAGLMLTFSRRTPPDAAAAIREALAGTATEIWDGQGENPYFGYLGLADRVIVTGDSVNMVSEAAATGRPVQVIRLPIAGRADKFERFHAAMERRGATRPFGGTLEDWDFQPPDDTQRAADRLCALMSDSGNSAR